jgi:hypothetical protein
MTILAFAADDSAGCNWSSTRGGFSPMRAVMLAGLLLSSASPAFAFDGLADCEKFALTFFKDHGADLRAIKIDRPSIIENVFDDNVGSQRVSTEYIGWAEATWAGKTTRERFVCLHAGDGAKPVYFSFIPLD